MLPIMLPVLLPEMDFAPIYAPSFAPSFPPRISPQSWAEFPTVLDNPTSSNPVTLQPRHVLMEHSPMFRQQQLVQFLRGVDFSYAVQ